MDNPAIVTVYLVFVLLASADIVRRVILEFINVRRRNELNKRMRRLRRPVQPWVTVIIYGKKDEASLAATIRSVQRSRYHAYDIVVVGPRARTYQTAYRKSKRGKVVLCVPAGYELDPTCIKRAVALREGRRNWRVAIKEKSRGDLGISDIVRHLNDIVWPRPKMVTLYSPAAVRQARISDPNTLVSTAGLLAAQLLLAAAIVLGVIYGNLLVLWWAWLLITGYLLALIWLYDETLNRWKLTFSAPSALFLVPVASFIQGIFQVSTRK